MRNFNFKLFLEDALDGHSLGTRQESPETTLEFPTVSTTAPVLNCRVVGKNYCIQLQGEATIYIECNKYHRMFGKELPKPGEIVTAVWYKFKDGKQENYTLKQLRFNQAR